MLAGSGPRLGPRHWQRGPGGGGAEDGSRQEEDDKRTKSPKHTPSKLSQDETDDLNGPITREETVLII